MITCQGWEKDEKSSLSAFSPLPGTPASEEAEDPRRSPRLVQWGHEHPKRLVASLKDRVNALVDAADDAGEQIDGTGEKQGFGILIDGMPLEERVEFGGIEGKFQRTLDHDADRTLGGEAVENGSQ